MLCVVNIVVCPYCDRHLRVEQEIQDAKLKCRFCKAIFAGSTQSTDSVPAGGKCESPKRPKRLNPVRYARVRGAGAKNDRQDTTVTEAIETVEVLETPNPEITKRPDVETQQARPRIAALGAEANVCTDNQNEAVDEKPSAEPQDAVKAEVIFDAASDTPEPLNNQQVTPKPPMTEIPAVEESKVEIPVVVTPPDEPENSTCIAPSKKPMLKWIIAGAIILFAIGLAGLAVINR